MTQAATAPVETPAAAPSPAAVVGEVDNVDARADAIKTMLRSEPREVDEEEASVDADVAEIKEAKADKAKEADAKPVDDERTAALKRAAELERANVKGAAKLAERENKIAQREQQFEQMHRAYEAREKAIAAAEKVFEDPALLLEKLEAKVPAKQLAQWLMDAQKPEKQSEWAAKREAEKITPELAQIRAELAELRAEKQQAKQKEAEQQAQQRFLGEMQTIAAEYPRTAAMMAKHPDRFLRFADDVANMQLRDEGSTTVHAIAKYIEADLSEYGSYTAQNGSAAAPSTPVNGTASVQANTLSSRNSAGRSQLLSDEDATLSLDERAERLKKAARRSG